MGDEAFRELSKVDPEGKELLNKVGVAPICSSLDRICYMYWIFTVPVLFLLLNFFFRLWLKIKVTSGLPKTTDKKLLHEMKGLDGNIVHHQFPLR